MRAFTDESSGLAPLLRIAEELAARTGEAHLVVTVPNPKYHEGAPYIVAESMADAHEADEAHHTRVEPPSDAPLFD